MYKQWLITAAAAFVMAYGVNAKAGNDFTQGWTFEFTPYLWAAGIDGDVTVRGHKANVNMDFSDLVKTVDIGGSFLGVAHKDRFVIWTQFDYFGLDNKDLGNALPSDSRLQTTMLLFEAAAGYQFDGPYAGSKLDAMLGLRYGSFENKLSIEGVKAKRSTELVDPMLVVRPRFPLNDWLALSATLAVGGGGDSEFIYELQPQLDFQFTKNLVAQVGYRRLYYKFEGKGDSDFSAALQGFIIGMGVTF